MRLRNRRQRVDGAGPAPHVHPEDRAGLRRHGAFDLFRIQRVRPRIDVGEHRANPMPLQGVSRGDKRERWNDDFAPEAERADR